MEAGRRILMVVPGSPRDAEAIRRAAWDARALSRESAVDVALAGESPGADPAWRRFPALAAGTARAEDAHTLAEQFDYARSRGPYSRELLEFLHREGARYELVLFYGYAAASTAFGLPLQPERAVLVPFAEEAAELRLAPYRALFHAPLAIAYRSDAERALVRQTFRNDQVYGGVVAEPEALAAFLGEVPR
jgi:hypothetical protein